MIEADPILRIASRGSTLALAQSRSVVHRIRQLYPDLSVELQAVSSGEAPANWEPGAPLPPIQDEKGGFARGVRLTLLRGQCHAAVHSAKDLPIDNPNGLRVVAYPPRIDARDALISPHPNLISASDAFQSPLNLLQKATTIGTSSPRRAAYLRALAPQCEPIPMRGNVDSRIRHLLRGSCGALILALAGLIRLKLIVAPLDQNDPGPWPLNLSQENTPKLYAYPLSLESFVPAPAQGALAVEARLDTPHSRLWGQLNDAPTQEAVAAERLVASGLEANCASALGVNVFWQGPQLTNDPGWVCMAQFAHPQKGHLLQASSCAPLAKDAASSVIRRIQRQLS